MIVLGNVRVTLEASDEGLRESINELTLQPQSSLRVSVHKNGSETNTECRLHYARIYHIICITYYETYHYQIYLHSNLKTNVVVQTQQYPDTCKRREVV